MNTNIPPKHQVRTAGATAFSAVRIFFLSLFLLLSGGSVRAQVDAEMVTIMGRNALSVDDYLTAIRYFNQAIEAQPFLSRPYYYRAYTNFTLTLPFASVLLSCLCQIHPRRLYGGGSRL